MLITWPGALGSQAVVSQGVTGSALVLLPSAAPPWATFDSPSQGAFPVLRTHSLLFLTLHHLRVHSLMLIAPSASGSSRNSRYPPRHLSKPR